MALTIVLSPEAEDHLHGLSARDRATIVDRIQVQLVHQPHVAVRNRKQLEPNPLAGWELRLGDYRVFYDVHEERTEGNIIAVGKKEHNRLLIADEEVEL